MHPSHLERAYRAFVSCHDAVHAATSEAQLLSDVCRIAVDDLGFKLAWVGLLGAAGDVRVHPAAQSGYEHGYLQSIAVTCGDDELGHGPTGRAIRERRPVVCRNIATDPQFAPWRDDAMARGYGSSVAIPICDGDRCLGALNLYAAEPDAFDDDEVALLEELGIDLMLGLVRLRGVRRLEELQMRLDLAANANETTIAKATAVAHDLANLLQVISTAIDAARLCPERDARDDALAEATRAAASAGSMLRQIVSLTRRAQDSSERSMVDHVAGSLHHLLARLAPGATVKLELGAPGIAARLAALSLERILINLVVNAGHALEHGGTITISTAHRRVPSEGARLASGLLPGGDYVEIVVADSGTGIAPDVLPRVFEPYFTTKGDGGTGLGLPSVLSMVRAVGGGLDVSSVVGEGTRFSVLVPLVPVPS